MVFAKSYLPFLPFTETLVTKFVKRYQLCVLCSNRIIQLLPVLKVNIIIVHLRGVVFPRALARENNIIVHPGDIVFPRAKALGKTTPLG